MLKSIVNGAEYDITRISMKGKNLLDIKDGTKTINNVVWTAYHGTITAQGTTTSGSESDAVIVYDGIFTKSGNYINYCKIQASKSIKPPAGVYTFSANANPSNSSRIALIVGDDGAYFSDSSARKIAVGETFSVNGNEYVMLVVSAYISLSQYNFADIMLNAGSIALPYEPYGYQNGWEVRDNQNRLIWGREDELQTTTGILPFKGYSLPVKVKSLLGNTVQNGTPAPDNVVIPEFCGVRTKQLYDEHRTETTTWELKTDKFIIGCYDNSKSIALVNIESYSFSKNQITVKSKAGGCGIGVIVEIESNKTYTLSFDTNKEVASDNSYFGFNLIFSNGSLGEYTAPLAQKVYTFNSGSAKYAYIVFRANPSYGEMIYSNIMLNSGSTSLPYEPYGYKITFENNGENLFDKSATNTANGYDDSGYLVSSGSIASSLSYFVSEYIPVNSNTVYTLVYHTNQVTSPSVCFYDVNKNYISGEAYARTIPFTFTTPNNAAYIRFSGVDVSKDIIMLNLGSTALPYSPYLNKTTPIYLSEVPTIRRIKKRVFNGTENWTLWNYETAVLFYTPVVDGTGNQVVSSHFGQRKTGSLPIAGNAAYNGDSNKNMIFRLLDDTTITTVEGWKAWLAAQYAAGTPVTVWYVLAEPETGIVNDPLAKIGDYADELTNIQVHGLSAPLYGIEDYKDILNLATGVFTGKIKKLVLTGNENFNTDEYLRFSISVSGIKYYTQTRIGRSYCSHYECLYHAETYNNDWNNVYYQSGGSLFFHDRRFVDATAFKSYLTNQYQNGTPVTIWYVLATPETGTVTVPTGMTGEIEGYLTQISTPTPEHPSIPKWNGEEETGGTYAVTVYNLPEIETTTGKNTLTVETEKIYGLTNPLCGIVDYKDVMNLSTGIITRKIKKLVFDGTEETWLKSTRFPGNFYNPLLDTPRPNIPPIMCSHAVYTSTISETAYVYGKCAIDGSSTLLYLNLFIGEPSWEVSDFKQYLADQYSAGTPVTVWYVLETPETETITVPYGLECSIEGYLTQSGTPTPSNPITPDSNGILEPNGTYAVEVSLVPSNLTVKGHIKELT